MLIPNKNAGDALTHEEINQPFWLKSATYDAENDRIIVTIGPGRADWGGGTLTEKLTDSTLYITTPSINTTYYIFLKNDSTFIYSTSGTPRGGEIRIASIAVGETKDALTVSDLRGMLPTPAGALYSIDGVDNPYGNVDLEAGLGISITPDNVNKKITITSTGEQAPAPHASTHASGGSDPVTPAAIGAAVASKGVTNGDSHDHVGGDGAPITEATLSLSDVTTNNVSTTKHGFTPKAPNDTTKYLRGDGAWATVTATNSDTVDSYHAGNATNQVAVSNGSVCSTLNADLLDGYHASSFSLTTHNHDSAYAPLAHVGGNDGEHATATTSFAGFMSAADKTKLDGIETGATADQTPAEILTAIKTEDGDGSGLDADLLDGSHKADLTKLSALATLKISGSVSVSANGLQGVTIQAASAAHRFYQYSAYCSGGAAVNVFYGAGVTANGTLAGGVHVYIARGSADYDILYAANTTSNNQTVYYKVYQYTE
jgi:hypothetical protein